MPLFATQIIDLEPRPRDNDYISWTGPGFIRIREGGSIEFTIDDVVQSGEYDVILRYEPLVSYGVQTWKVPILPVSVFQPVLPQY